jgi:uncharacterized surface protein with fasciclin (FAS1) repeats
MNVTLDGTDVALERVAVYSFPNYQFRLGDTVTCALVSSPPVAVDTTTVETTVVDTTVAETTTTTTTIPETTPPTTTPPTPPTTQPAPPPTITVPPQPDATLWDVIFNSPDLSGIRGWIEQAGLQPLFEDPNATITFFAPSNPAIASAIPPSDLTRVVNTHIVDGDTVLLLADLAQMDGDDIDFVEQGPHQVSVAGDTVSIDGAAIIVPDVEAVNGVIHVIDGVLAPAAP